VLSRFTALPFAVLVGAASIEQCVSHRRQLARRNPESGIRNSAGELEGTIA